MNLPDDETVLLRGHYRATADASVSAPQFQSTLERIRVTPQRSTGWSWPRRPSGGLAWVFAPWAPRLGLTLLVLAAVAAAAVVGARLLETIRPIPLPVSTPTGSMTAPRSDFTMTLLGDGPVLIAGGWGQAGEALASAELYDPRTGTFTPTGSMHAARSFATATLLDDGRVLIAGGQPRGAYHVAGWTPGIDGAELYDPRTGTFRPTGSMTQGRAGHTATMLGDGRVLIAGGDGPLALEAGQSEHSGSLASAEIYDPVSGTFTAAASMARSRFLHDAVPLPDGRVLVAGGVQGEDWTKGSHGSAGAGLSDVTTAEIYDPSTDVFQEMRGWRQTGRQWLAAALVDGDLLVMGDDQITGDGSVSPWAYLFDPVSGQRIELGAPAIEDHGQHERAFAAAPMADGRMLIVGVRTLDGLAASVDVFDPASRTFDALRLAAGLGGGSVLLADGRTLIAGGSSFDYQPTSAANLVFVDGASGGTLS